MHVDQAVHPYLIQSFAGEKIVQMLVTFGSIVWFDSHIEREVIVVDWSGVDDEHMAGVAGRDGACGFFQAYRFCV
jgi:hypothetical protein